MVLEREWRFLSFLSDEHILLDEGGLECSEEVVGTSSGSTNIIVFWFLEIVSGGEAAGFSTSGGRDKGVAGAGAGAVGLHAEGVRMDRGEQVNMELLEGEEARDGENSWPC